MTDYSNGKLKNVSMRVVADTDLMSGDVLDLNDTMLCRSRPGFRSGTVITGIKKDRNSDSGLFLNPAILNTV